MAKGFRVKYTNFNTGMSHIRRAGTRGTLCAPEVILTAAQLLTETPHPQRRICLTCHRLWFTAANGYGTTRIEGDN